MANLGFRRTVIELITFGSEHELIRVRATVLDSTLRQARLISEPNVDGYSRGDVVEYQYCEGYPFPLISGRLDDPPSADVVPITDGRHRTPMSDSE